MVRDDLNVLRHSSRLQRSGASHGPQNGWAFPLRRKPRHSRARRKLGMRLLSRTTRSVAPAEAGEQLLARLGPALHEVEAALDQISGFRDKPAGRARLLVPRLAVCFGVRRLRCRDSLRRIHRKSPRTSSHIRNRSRRVTYPSPRHQLSTRLGRFVPLGFREGEEVPIGCCERPTHRRRR
jgi:hypothetical protein